MQKYKIKEGSHLHRMYGSMVLTNPREDKDAGNTSWRVLERGTFWAEIFFSKPNDPNIIRCAPPSFNERIHEKVLKECKNIK